MEVIKYKKKSLLELYPYSARDLVQEVKDVSKYKENAIYQVIKENNIKENTNYSAYNFRNKRQEEMYAKEGKIPSGVPSLYNKNAIDFILKILSQQ